MIESVSNPLDDESLGVVRFDPNKHLIVRSSWLEAMKRRLKWSGVKCAPRLFVYRHLIHGTFVLACWLIEPRSRKHRGLMTEIGHLGFDGEDTPPFEWLLEAVQPGEDRVKNTIRARREREYEKRMAEAASREEGELIGKWLRKRGEEHEGRMVESGFIPYMSNEEAKFLGMET